MQATMHDIHAMVGGLWIEARLLAQQVTELEKQLAEAQKVIEALKAQQEVAPLRAKLAEMNSK